MSDTALAAAGKAAGQAAIGQLTVALKDAATNAAKPGPRTTEWKATIGGIVLAALLTGLQALSVIPGPWMLPAVVLSAGLSVGAYAMSRGTVKGAALAAAATAAATISDNIGAP
jgi:hypothetical protein